MRTSNVQRPTSNIEQRMAERPVRRWTFSVRRSTFALNAAFIVAFCVLPSALVSAAPTQEDVLRSISQNVNESSGGGKLLAVVAGGVAIILLLAVLQQRQQREARPKSLEHAGRLLKEVMKSVPLKPAELKQLKLLVERKREEDEQTGGATVASPLTLILCPSVLVRAMRNPPAKVDRKVIAQLARKLGAHSKH
jgi:hypothetical protein